MDKEIRKVLSSYDPPEGQREKIYENLMKRKETITMTAGTNTRKHGRRFTAFIAAAAIMTAGAIGAGAYFARNGGTWNGLKSVFEGSGQQAVDRLSENADAALEKAASHNGTLVSNTFDGIDVKFDGIVRNEWIGDMGDQTFEVFTLKKTDGTAFAAPEKGMRYSVSSADGSFAGSGSFKYENTIVSVNEDGTLSVTVQGFVKDADTDTLRIGFKDIMLEAEGIDKGVNASEVLGGEAVFDIDMTDVRTGAVTKTADYNGGTLTAKISPMRIILFGTGKGFEEVGDIPKLTVNYKNGSSETVECMGLGGEEDSRHIFFEKGQPFDTDSIAAIEFDGVNIQVNE